MAETELSFLAPVLDDFGNPQNFGWGRKPCFTYDHGSILTRRVKISESDRYILISPTHEVIFEILDDGYLGYLFVSVVSLNGKKRSSQKFITFFSLGCFNLPGDSETGSIKMRQNKNILDFAIMEGGVRIIKADFPRFGRYRSLRGEIVLTPPPEAESLYTNMAWRGKGSAFICSRRSPCFSAEGVILFSSTEIVFTRGNSWGIFDWNRGVRPRSDLRFWAAGCGQAGDHQAGFVVGYNSADSALGTENAFFLDGRLHKLDQVTFHIPLGKHMPWRFTSNDNRLEMLFTPTQERDESNQMFLYSLKRRQFFGSFSGKVLLDDGNELNFNNISGMTERRKSNL
jgi:hypothetical protein